ncbi:hypothetical protein [Actinacidiphila soli]|uniref:hypothetical protein n=1 Tax=Actinacidiphila soli TaxID=2487275 RepID=UPI000FCC2EA4|nr:hypothetical protein [Actinacidiphila soli]
MCKGPDYAGSAGRFRTARASLAYFRPPRSRLGRHLIGALTGPAMEHNPVDLLDDLAAEAGFTPQAPGDVRPWLRYVQASRPEAMQRAGRCKRVFR